MPSAFLSWLVYTVAPAAEMPLGEFEKAPWYVSAIMIVLFAPFVETLIMAGAATLLSRLFGPTVAVFGSTVAWGALHSASVPVWKMVVWWAFLILTIVYLTWRPRGFWIAVMMATAVHALQNGVAVLGMYQV